MRSSDLSEDVRARLKHYPAPHAAHRGVVPAPPTRGPVAMGGPDIGQRVLEAERVLARLTAQFQSSDNAFALTRILERQEVVSSSSIEGTYSTLDALLEMEENGDGAEETVEIRGATLGLNYGLDKVRAAGMNAFDVAMVCGIHEQLGRHIPGYRGVPGQLRDQVVWIGGRGDPSTSTWNPPPPDDVPTCLNDTLAYMRHAPEDVSHFAVIVRAAIAHAHFEGVHPFLDGNGRIGRLLIPLFFAAEGHVPLYLSPWIEAHKTDYYTALKDAQQRLDHTGMIDVLARAVIGTEAEFNVTMGAVTALENEWSNIKLRRNSAAHKALPLLKSYPVLRAGTLADLIEVSFKAASDGLAKLVEAGVMVEKTGYARNRIFTAPSMLAILMRPFGEDPNDI